MKGYILHEVQKSFILSGKELVWNVTLTLFVGTFTPSTYRDNLYTLNTGFVDSIPSNISSFVISAGMPVKTPEMEIKCRGIYALYPFSINALSVTIELAFAMPLKNNNFIFPEVFHFRDVSIIISILFQS